MTTNFKSNTVSVVYNRKNNKRIGSIYAVKSGQSIAYIARHRSFVFAKTYGSIQKAANAFEHIVGKDNVIYS